MQPISKPRLSVHKFSSCDGCQLAILNLGEALLELVGQVELVHFAEAGVLNELGEADIALVEGSISTPADIERIQAVRRVSRYLITIGACATSGGLQALRNLVDKNGWVGQVYARPEYIASLDKVTPIREQVHVDAEIWGCPVNSSQVVAALRSLMAGFMPRLEQSRVCMECKAQQQVCVMVAEGRPCMGPVTRAGCGALCPAVGRECYACYGAAENANAPALAQRFRALSVPDSTIEHRFHAIHSHIEPFATGWNPGRKEGGSA